MRDKRYSRHVNSVCKDNTFSAHLQIMLSFFETRATPAIYDNVKTICIIRQIELILQRVPKELRMTL